MKTPSNINLKYWQSSENRGCNEFDANISLRGNHSHKENGTRVDYPVSLSAFTLDTILYIKSHKSPLSFVFFIVTHDLGCAIK